MSLDKLPINLFDLLVIVVLGAGLFKGRKHGMSEELVKLLEWLAILFGCAALYEWGGEMCRQLTNMFGPLSGYLTAYIGSALLIALVFTLVKRTLGGKLLGSDFFGRAEYYLGMGSGLVRFSCILLVGLALLNARYFSPAEVRAMQKYNDDVYGSDYFPGLHSLQESVFQKSITGPWIKENLGFLLIKPTEPQKSEYHQKEAFIP
jgi:uncharacterized membrane protein required for colicin V production